MASDPLKKWRVEEIIERGLQVIGETVEMLSVTPSKERGAQFAKGLTLCVLAAVDIDRNSRDAAKWLKEMKLGAAELREMLANHLREMPTDDFAQLLKQVGRTEKQAS
jgi:hypothetical protein